jgi:dTDP-glucose 4,6-dehydratase
MRILVTGGAGFIGSHFVRYWLRRHPGDEVRNLDKLTYAGNPENLSSVRDNPHYKFARGDICNSDDVDSVISGCQFVVNFAAESHVDRSLVEPESFVRTDVAGVFVLLEACLRHGIQRFLQVSTDEVYGATPSGAATEEAALRPSNPYAASKAGGELAGLSYFAQRAMHVVVTRGVNTFGPNQYPEKVIPLFLTNAIDDLPLPLYGDGLQEREWIYVLDHCTAIEAVLLRGEAGQVYNIGTGMRLTNLDLTKRILGQLGKPESLIVFVRDRPGHDRRYALDSQKIAGLGWTPTHDLESALAETVRWYRENEAWWRPIKSGAFRQFYERQYRERLRQAGRG